MTFGAHTTVNLAGLERLAAQYKPRTQAGITAALHEFQDDVMRRAPVETGGLSMATAVVTSDGESDADLRASAFSEARDAVDPLGAAPAPPGIGGTASCLAPYGAAVDNGHTDARSGNHVAAQPFWTEATEELRRKAPDIIARHLRGERG